MRRFEGRVALVTGAGRGQGRSHAVTLAEQGASVIAVDIAQDIPSIPYPLANEADLTETVRLVEETGQKCLAVQADVRSQADLDNAVREGVETFGQLDIVVGNQGIATFGPVWELDEAEWTDVLDVNLSGMWRLVKAAAGHMMERRQGSIVLVSSINAVEPGADYSHYNSSKAGVIAFAQNVALELGAYNIRCNCVLPGPIDTPMINWQGMYDRFVGPGAGRADLQKSLRHWTGLANRSMLPPRAVSDAVAWLSSDEAAHVTGITVPVDAGHLILPGFNHSPVVEDV